MAYGQRAAAHYFQCIGYRNRNFRRKQEFVFERFAKVDTFVQGTGLGLPIGRICAEKMGGSLVLDPDYTNGCRFLLTLPLKG